MNSDGSPNASDLQYSTWIRAICRTSSQSRLNGVFPFKSSRYSTALSNLLPYLKIDLSVPLHGASFTTPHTSFYSGFSFFSNYLHETPIHYFRSPFSSNPLVVTTLKAQEHSNYPSIIFHTLQEKFVKFNTSTSLIFAFCAYSFHRKVLNTCRSLPPHLTTSSSISNTPTSSNPSSFPPGAYYFPPWFYKQSLFSATTPHYIPTQQQRFPSVDLLSC